MDVATFLNKSAKFVLRNLKYDFRRIWYYFLGNKEYDKFIILTRSRTGSTLLVKLLNSHPMVEALNEPYQKKYLQTSLMVWNRIFSSKPKKIEKVGFKLMYYHDWEIKQNSVWDILQRNLGVKVIHLQRLNLLRCLISRELAFQTNAFHSNVDIRTKSSLIKPQIYIDPEKVIKNLELTKLSKKRALTLLKHHQMIELYYEDFTMYPNKLDKVLKFLNLSKVELKATLKKLNPEPVDQLISNYKEISERLKNTDWAYLLDLP